MSEACLYKFGYFPRRGLIMFSKEQEAYELFPNIECLRSAGEKVRYILDDDTLYIYAQNSAEALKGLDEVQKSGVVINKVISNHVLEGMLPMCATTAFYGKVNPTSLAHTSLKVIPFNKLSGDQQQTISLLNGDALESVYGFWQHELKLEPPKEKVLCCWC